LLAIGVSCLGPFDALVHANTMPPVDSPREGLLELPPDETLREARLQGRGRYRWFGLPVYDAELLAAASVREEQWQQQTFALRLVYARDLRGREIAKSSLSEMQNLGLVPAGKSEPWLQQMTQLFPDVQAGEAITGVHLAQRAARFWRAKQALGSIEDAAFTSAFFAIWLDPRTRAPQLRQALFGR